MKRFAFLLLCVPLIATAADIPQIVNSNRKASLEKCVNDTSNDCVNRNCMNSPDLNCQGSCLDQARNICIESREE